MQHDVAEDICRELLYCSRKLDRSIEPLVNSVDPVFLLRYKRSVGGIMGVFYDEFLRYIFDAYPDLEPDSMK